MELPYYSVILLAFIIFLIYLIIILIAFINSACAYLRISRKYSFLTSPGKLAIYAIFDTRHRRIHHKSGKT